MFRRTEPNAGKDRDGKVEDKKVRETDGNESDADDWQLECYNSMI